MYCEPTFIRGYFISRLLCDTLALVRQVSFKIEPSSLKCVTSCNIRFTTRNVNNGEILANLAKFSRSQIKVGLQYSKYSKLVYFEKNKEIIEYQFSSRWKIVHQKYIADFKAWQLWKYPNLIYNLLNNFGFFETNKFLEWLGEAIEEKAGKGQKDLTFKQVMYFVSTFMCPCMRRISRSAFELSQ
jgi:hypothetical protein